MKKVKEVNFMQTKWSLSDLYDSQNLESVEISINELDSQFDSFERFRNELNVNISATKFIEIMKEFEEILRNALRIYAFSGLFFAENTQNQKANSLLGWVEQVLAGIHSQNLFSRTLFFVLWWKDLDDQNAKRLLDSSGDYRYFLEQIRLFRPHSLNESEENIINLKNATGQRVLITLYSSITNRYVFTLEINGDVKELTRSELLPYMQGTDADLRAAAYQELFKIYGENSSILGQMYQALVRDWHNENLSLRKFSSPIAVRNLGNDIPDKAVDTLLDVARKNAGIFQRYFKMKASILGMEKLRRYDIYAPVVKAEKPFEYASAAQMVLDSFSEFDPKVGDLARRVFDQDHLDSEVRKGKRDGAFCWSVTPEMTPWVLLNYQGRPRDVATMAHELGHAIHSMLASHHSVFTFHSSLPLAETASTFGEMMLTDRLLAEESDENVRRDILFKQVDDAYATIMRQSYFALFEKQAHEMVVKNASVDELAAAYMENLKEQFGDSLELSDEFKWEWVSIPHIYHTPFYVYAYAFGQLLVLSLYQQFKREGEAFKPKYLKLLSAGGSESPAKILSEAGIDIESAAFWQGGFDVVDGLVKQLEELK